MSMKTMMESMRRGAATGTRIAVTRRVEYRSPIQVKSAAELQTAAWNRVGRTLHESMEREKASNR